jgi:hypothetical protein
MGDGSSGRRWSLIYAREARARVEDELAFHLEQRTRDNMARGMDAGAARAGRSSDSAIWRVCSGKARSCCARSVAPKQGATS